MEPIELNAKVLKQWCPLEIHQVLQKISEKRLVIKQSE